MQRIPRRPVAVHGWRCSAERTRHGRTARPRGPQCLSYRGWSSRQRIARVSAASPLTRFRTPRERLLGVFDAQGQLFTQPDFNGCAHLTASAEAQHGSPVECATDRYRQWVRSLFTELAREAVVADHEGLARQLHLLYDGGGVSARMDRDPSAATTASAAAAALFDAAVKDRKAVDAR
jgi:hypothetical protein